MNFPIDWYSNSVDACAVVAVILRIIGRRYSSTFASLIFTNATASWIILIRIWSWIIRLYFCCIIYLLVVQIIRGRRPLTALGIISLITASPVTFCGSICAVPVVSTSIESDSTDATGCTPILVLVNVDAIRFKMPILILISWTGK